MYDLIFMGVSVVFFAATAMVIVAMGIRQGSGEHQTHQEPITNLLHQVSPLRVVKIGFPDLHLLCLQRCRSISRRQFLR